MEVNAFPPVSQQNGNMEKLKQLFRLKYREDVVEGAELSRQLGLPFNEVIALERQLDAYLQTKLGAITAERLDFICPECLSARVIDDIESGERVCENCGVVFDEPAEQDDSLPFDTTYALTSTLSVGRSLGDTLQYRDQCRLQKRNGTADLPLRTRTVRVLLASENPALDRLLKEAYKLSKRFSLDRDYVFNNCLGRNMRRAFWLTRELDVKLARRSLVDTAFYFTLVQCDKLNVALPAKSEFSLDYALLGLILKLAHFLSVVKKETEPMKGIEALLQGNPNLL